MGGLREFAAVGDLTVHVGTPAVPFFEQALAGPRTVDPDRLAAVPAEAGVRGIDEVLTFDTAEGGTGSADRIVSDHAADMPIVHVNSGKLVFNSDLWNPTPEPPAPDAQRGGSPRSCTTRSRHSASTSRPSPAATAAPAPPTRRRWTTCGSRPVTEPRLIRHADHMEFSEVLRHRRMVRAYRPDPVPDDVLRRVVRVIRRAPSAGFSQGHRLAVITAPAVRARIAAISEGPYVEAGFTAWISGAPVLIALGVREASYHERYQEPDKLDDGAEIPWPVPYWWFDSGALLSLLQLAATSEGLATGFFGPGDDSRFAAVHALTGFPADVSLAGILTVGYSAEDPAAPPSGSAGKRAKLPLEELISWRS
nr:nitroreductase family protein [Amycolatopsis sp. FDAARGOS 1241]